MRKQHLLMVILLVATLLLQGSSAQSASAGLNTWTQVTPRGYRGVGVYCMAIDPTAPTTLYESTSSGLYKSINGGQQWISANIYTPIRAIAINPKNPATLYAGALGGVYKSTDGGVTWSTSLTTANDFTVVALAIDPLTPSTLYAGAPDGLVRSTDSGATWTQVLQATIYSLAIDPLTPATLYAGTEAGVARSTDGGDQWTTVMAGGAIHALAIDPARPAILYAGTSGATADVYKSLDHGDNWSGPNPAFDFREDIDVTGDGAITALAIDPRAPTTIYVAVSYNVKGPAYPRHLTWGNFGDLFKSTDDGQNWAPLYSDDGMTFLAIDPATTTRLYLGTNDNGAFASADGGGTWGAINAGLPQIPLPAYSLAIDPKTPSILYAGTSSGVYKSLDGGASWNVINPGTKAISTLVTDPTAPGTLYAGSEGGSGYHFACAGLSKTTDGGETWSGGGAGLCAFDRASIKLIYLAIDPLTPTTLYAITDLPGIYKSTDGGNSFTELGVDLAWGNSTDGPYALAIDPITPTSLYVGTNNGVFKSTDGGKNWSAASAGLTNLAIYALAIDPAAPTTVYAGSAGGAFKSQNGGKSWSAINSGLADDFPIRSLAVDPKATTTLYAGTNFTIHKSTDGGGSWNLFNPRLPVWTVYNLIFDKATPATLYALDGTDLFAIQQIPHALVITMPYGAPGSIFTVTASDFPPNETIRMAINGMVLGGAQTNATGGMTFYLETFPSTGQGVYVLTAPDYPGAIAQFLLRAGGEVHTKDGIGTTFVVPNGVAYLYSAYFPLIGK
jgi:photosystem II stability/assembly factor-like uncharacterized protein